MSSDDDLVDVVGLLVLAGDPDVEEPEEGEDEPQVFENTQEHFMIEESLVQLQQIENYYGHHHDEVEHQRKGIRYAQSQVQGEHYHHGHLDRVEFVHSLHHLYAP